MDSSGWYPGGAAAVVPGKTGPWRALGPGEQRKGPRMTTNQRANAAVEQYWIRRAPEVQNGITRPHTACSSPERADARRQQFRPGALPGRVPGGERDIAARVKQEGRSATVALGNHEGFYVPSWPATPRDLSEKEDYSKRGIPGFTGATPAPHQKAPGWPTPEDPSSTFAINACDARRPWTSGVRGYTGHQLPGAHVGRSERTRNFSPDPNNSSSPEQRFNRHPSSPTQHQARPHATSPQGPYQIHADAWDASSGEQRGMHAHTQMIDQHPGEPYDQACSSSGRLQDINRTQQPYQPGVANAAMKHGRAARFETGCHSTPESQLQQQHNSVINSGGQQLLSNALHGVQMDEGHACAQQNQQEEFQHDVSFHDPRHECLQSYQQGQQGRVSSPLMDRERQEKPWRPSSAVQPPLHTTAGAGGYPTSVHNVTAQRSQCMARDMAIQTNESVRHVNATGIRPEDRLQADEHKYGVTFRDGVLPKPIWHCLENTETAKDRMRR